MVDRSEVETGRGRGLGSYVRPIDLCITKSLMNGRENKRRVPLSAVARPLERGVAETARALRGVGNVFIDYFEKVISPTNLSTETKGRVPASAVARPFQRSVAETARAVRGVGVPKSS